MNILTGKFKKLSHPIRAFFIKRDIVNLGLNLNLAEILVDGTVNYNGDVNLPFQDLESFPFKFGVINGAFNCSDNHLTTLKNAPHIINGDFYCSRNRLSSLKFMPEVISGSVFCRYNELLKKKVIKADELEWKFKNDEIAILKEALENDINQINNTKTRRYKL